MRILTISDSFKGSLTSKQVGQIITEELIKKHHQAEYWPISDGGEGFLEAYQQIINKDLFKVYVTGVFFDYKKEAQYLINNETAYVELASSSGISDVINHLNPFLATTYGVGEVIKHIITNHHPKTIIVGVGGSASVDLGTGMLEALGVKFYDKNHQLITSMCHDKLIDVYYIDTSECDKLIKETKFITLSDIDAPILGKNGGLFLYSKQKGATINDLFKMEINIEHYINIVKKEISKEYIDKPYMGSAGGITYSLHYFLHSELNLGIDYLLKVKQFDKVLSNYDLIITGEGQFDEQTLQGKVVSGIMKYQPKRLIIIAGCQKIINDNYEVYAIVPNITTKKNSINNPEYYLRKLISSINIK